MHSSDELLLQHCCALAWQHQTLALPNPSVGALVLAPNGEILSSGVHIKAGDAHAEVIALRDAYYKLTQDKAIFQAKSPAAIHEYLLANHNGIFHQCSLYVSLEPCNHYGKTPPCALLIAKLKLAKVCIATTEAHIKAAGGLAYLLAQHINASFMQTQILNASAKALLLPFETLRNKGRFVLYKLAQRLDGSYKNGRISCEQSQVFTHNQRSVCDYICISGATLRNDNPQLNARYATPPYDNSATPEVLIFSHHLKALPVANPFLASRIHFSNNPKDIEGLEGFVIIEGGWNLLHTLRGYVDMLLIHQALICAQGEDLRHTFSGDFKLMASLNIGEDIALWLV